MNQTGWQKDSTYVPCPDCGLVPVTHDGPGVSVHMPGTVHRSTCPRVPRLSPEAQAQLQADLDEIARCQRRAMTEAHAYVIG